MAVKRFIRFVFVLPVICIVWFPVSILIMVESEDLRRSPRIRCDILPGDADMKLIVVLKRAVLLLRSSFGNL